MGMFLGLSYLVPIYNTEQTLSAVLLVFCTLQIEEDR